MQTKRPTALDAVKISQMTRGPRLLGAVLVLSLVAALGFCSGQAAAADPAPTLIYRDSDGVTVLRFYPDIPCTKSPASQFFKPERAKESHYGEGEVGYRSGAVRFHTFCWKKFEPQPGVHDGAYALVFDDKDGIQIPLNTVQPEAQ